METSALLFHYALGQGLQMLWKHLRVGWPRKTDAPIVCIMSLTRKLVLLSTMSIAVSARPVKDCNGPVKVGGCTGTQFGCCANSTVPKADTNGTNCNELVKVGGCTGTQFGCCTNSTAPKSDTNGTNCKVRSKTLQPMQN